MKVEWHAVLRDYDLNPIKDERGQNMTLGLAAVVALNAPTEEMKNMSAEEKVQRWSLSSRINALRHAPTELAADDAKRPDEEFNVEDLALVRKAIGQHFMPVVVGPAYAILDGKGPPS